jgi:hypothetical protein
MLFLIMMTYFSIMLHFPQKKIAFLKNDRFDHFIEWAFMLFLRTII